MANKTPVKATFTGSNVTGLAEFQTSDTIAVTDGGTGLGALGSANTVLGVNSAGNGLEYRSQSAITGTSFSVTDTTSGSSAGPELSLIRDITGADSNYIGQIKFTADNDANQSVNFAKITGKIGDASDGTEDGILEIAHIKAGSQNINVRMTSTEFKIMNGTDFDVETHNGSSAGLRLGNTLVTSTAAELNHSDGVTSNIQTQLDAKATSSFAIAQAVALG
jgi:hypothetical protein